MSRGLLGLAGAFLALLEQNAGVPKTIVLSTKNHISIVGRGKPPLQGLLKPFGGSWCFFGGPCGVNGGCPGPLFGSSFWVRGLALAGVALLAGAAQIRVSRRGPRQRPRET